MDGKDHSMVTLKQNQFGGLMNSLIGQKWKKWAVKKQTDCQMLITTKYKRQFCKRYVFNIQRSKERNIAVKNTIYGLDFRSVLINIWKKIIWKKKSLEKPLLSLSLKNLAKSPYLQKIIHNHYIRTSFQKYHIYVSF